MWLPSLERSAVEHYTNKHIFHNLRLSAGHSCCSRPHTPLLLPGKLLPSQLFWFHVSTFLLICSRCYCQTSFRQYLNPACTWWQEQPSVHSFLALLHWSTDGDCLWDCLQPFPVDPHGHQKNQLHAAPLKHMLHPVFCKPYRFSDQQWALSGKYPPQTTMLNAQ